MTDIPENQDSTEQTGFSTPELQEFDLETDELTDEVITSQLSEQPSLKEAQLLELSDSEGSLLYYPFKPDTNLGVNLEIGDVLFLRERGSVSDEENGLVVQVISKETASYPHADTKAIFRLMVRIKSVEHQRFSGEPREVIDEFLVAQFKVRAAIQNGEWRQASGKVVTRNIDIFQLSEQLLAGHIFETVVDHNLNLGEYKSAPVEFFGGGFEKINLITGMKGGGKSHIAKGTIVESLSAGMSSVVFDINNEYNGIPDAHNYIIGQNIVPGQNNGLNVKFRLDRIPPSIFIDLVERLAPFAERTALIARARIPTIIKDRKAAGHCPDIQFLINQASNVIQGNGEPINNMRMSYRSSLDITSIFNLIMTEEEARLEDEFLRATQSGQPATVPAVISLRSALFNMEHGHPGVSVFGIGGLPSFVQYSVVDLVIETLKDICKRQAVHHEQDDNYVPMYPTVYFEEAHMYMEMQKINELLPLIRHFGMNVFFVTNTPGALPDSVYRLIDNVIMTRIVNKKDIDQVKNCGLADAETIEGFAKSLDKHYALLLSSQDGATKNFPLVFHVRNFELAPSGVTRSRWAVLKQQQEHQAASDNSSGDDGAAN